jgi:hypothetical protein
MSLAYPPLVAELRRTGARKVLLYFTDGAVIEMIIPVRTAHRIRIIDQGLAVKFGAGPLSEVSSWTLRERPGLVWARDASKRMFPGQRWAFAHRA